MKYFTSFGMPILPTKHDDIVMACRTLEAVAWAEENDVSIGVRQSGFREASVRLHGERTFMLGKNYLEAIEALRAKVEPRKLTDEDLGRLDQEADEYRDIVTEGTKDLEAMPEPPERKTAPDKRVPAELMDRLLAYLYNCQKYDNLRLHASGMRSELLDCPDIIDEPATLPTAQKDELRKILRIMYNSDHGASAAQDAIPKIQALFGGPVTLHPTAQAVLDAVAIGDMGRLSRAHETWYAAGRPTVVHETKKRGLRVGMADLNVFFRELRDGVPPESWDNVPQDGSVRVGDVCTCSSEDAATLAALRECRELGLDAVVTHDDQTVYGVPRGPLNEAMAAYKEAQRPQVEDSPSPHDVIDYMVSLAEAAHEKHPGRQVENDVLSAVYRFATATRSVFGPRCPDKPEGE